MVIHPSERALALERFHRFLIRYSVPRSGRVSELMRLQPPQLHRRVATARHARVSMCRHGNTGHCAGMTHKPAHCRPRRDVPYPYLAVGRPRQYAIQAKSALCHAIVIRISAPESKALSDDDEYRVVTRCPGAARDARFLHGKPPTPCFIQK
eukprot:5458632-Pyramimonas_sp.AAC.2